MNFRRPEQPDVTAVLGFRRGSLSSPSALYSVHANLPKRIILWSLGLAAFAGLTGVAFSAWLGQGSAILLTMAESGLAWCF